MTPVRQGENNRSIPGHYNRISGVKFDAYYDAFLQGNVSGFTSKYMCTTGIKPMSGRSTFGGAELSIGLVIDFARAFMPGHAIK